MVPVLGQDLVVDSGTTNITSSTNYANTYIGFNSTNSNNLLNVLGSGVVLSNSTNVIVGFFGSSNSLVISDAGSVVTTDAAIGLITNSSNNIATVTGTDSTLSIGRNLFVGSDGSSNSLVISNSGSVVVISNAGIGYTTNSSNNSVLVTGTNSTLSVAVDLGVGNARERKFLEGRFTS